MSKKLEMCNVATFLKIKFYSKSRQWFKQPKITHNTSKVLVSLHHYVKTLVKVHRGYLNSGYDWNPMVVSTFTSMYPLGRCTKSSRLIDYYLDSLRSVTPTTQPSRITRQENTARAPQRLGPIWAEQLGLALPNRGSILLAKVCIIQGALVWIYQQHILVPVLLKVS